MSPVRTLALGTLSHYLTLENPTTVADPDGDGGYTQTWAPLSPGHAWASITAATARALERIVANTTVAQASHIVTMRYHPDVTTQTRISWVDKAGTTRTANVTDVTDVDERGIQLVLLVMETTRE